MRQVTSGNRELRAKSTEVNDTIDAWNLLDCVVKANRRGDSRMRSTEYTGDGL